MKKPKILFLDIETSLITANMFSIGYGITVHADQIVKNSHTDIICIGYKWEGQKAVKCPTWGLRKQDSRAMLDEVVAQIEKADAVVGHNGDRFDVKLINTLRMMHRQPPIAWPTTIDTLKMVKKHFRFNSNKLDYLSRVILGDRKVRTGGLDLWNDVQFKKCPKAMKRMVEYCKKDVILLEDVYKEIAPYCDSKINRAIIMGNDKHDCPSCGDHNVRKYGKLLTKTGQFQKWQCTSCLHIYRGKKIKN